jgi:hypothetical protein
MRNGFIAVLAMLILATPARADAAPPWFVWVGGLGCVAAICFAVAVTWGGILLARRSGRKNRPDDQPPGDDEFPTSG